MGTKKRIYMQSVRFQTAGERYGNFLITKISELSEIHCTLIEVEHEPTGAQIMHLASDDDENLFNLSFRTLPEHSDGVAHILEHIVLCGSKKFPIRDPFFGMKRRSLNTFMNALTGGDFTCYPAASQVPKDFYNLLDVYLDAVFRPQLTKQSFLQEGHRLEFMKPDDPNSPLLFKGIVFNEMKGAMASGEARLGVALMHALFPDLTYGVNSGGDPKEIPNLTYEDLKAFHAKYYHPSRCLFYFYGNIPLEQHLDFLEKHAFEGVQKVPPIPLLPKQSRFKEKVVKTATYPISEEEDLTEKTLVGMSWLTCSILEQEELLALNVLDVVLAGTDAAPLKMALLKSNLCKQADAFLDNEMSEVPFTIVCKGCEKESGKPLEELVRATLAKIEKEGLPEHLIDAAIHQIEMGRSEITGNSSPYALSLFWRSALLKQHGGNPEDGLKVHTLFHRLREKVKDPRYLPSLIRKYLLDNSHFVRLDMHPDKTLAHQEIHEEEKKLVALCQKLQDRDVKHILQQSKELIAYQESAKEENFDLLPNVGLEDVKKEGKEFPLIKEKVGNFDLFTHLCFTNEMIYSDIIFDLPHIEERNLPFLRLFALLLPQVGCGGRNYQQHLEYLLEHTGGVGLWLDLCLQADDPSKMRPSLAIRGKALKRKLDKLFPIFHDLIVSADFTDVNRLKELLMQHLHAIENSVMNSSLRYAVNLAARGLSTASKIANAWFGLDYYWALKEIVAAFEKNPKPLIENLQRLQSECLGVEKMDLILSCDEESLETLKQEGFFGLSEMPLHPFMPWKGDYAAAESQSQGRVTAAPVAFTAMLFPSVCFTHPAAAALSIASEIMENKILHKRIREQGGAYGAGAVNGLLSGQFYFYAYRDPHLKTTLDAFREAVEEMIAGNFNDADLKEAKLCLFQDIDSPTPPGGRGITAYSRLRGERTAERRQQFRNHLFTCQKEEIIEGAKKYLLPGVNEGVVVSFAGKELLEKENDLLKEKALPIFQI